MIFDKIFEWDDFLTPEEFNVVMRDAHENSYDVAGISYKGMNSVRPAGEHIVSHIADRISSKLGVWLYWKRQFQYRATLEDQKATTYNEIHCDVEEAVNDHNLVSVILYLQGIRPDERMNFYQSDAIGTYSYNMVPKKAIAAVGDKWHNYQHVDLKVNKLIMFPSQLIHGTTPFGGYGKTKDDCRLILPMFFHVGFNELHHKEPYLKVRSLK